MAGVVIGLAGAVAMARLVSAFLSGVGVADVGTFAAAVAALLVVAAGATAVPALRAARASPASSLRSE